MEKADGVHSHRHDEYLTHLSRRSPFQRLASNSFIKDHRGKRSERHKTALPLSYSAIGAEVGVEPTACRLEGEVTLPYASMIYWGCTMWCRPLYVSSLIFKQGNMVKVLRQVNNFSISPSFIPCYNKRRMQENGGFRGGQGKL